MGVKVNLQTDAIKGNEMSTAQQQAMQSDLLNRIKLQEQKKKAREEYRRKHIILSSRMSDEEIDKAIFISQQQPPQLRQDYKTKEQLKAGNEEIKRREELQQLEKNMDTADKLMSISTDYIPLVGSLLRAGQYDIARDYFGRDYARNRYGYSPLLNTTLDLATIPFGIGTKQLASSYIGGIGGRYIGDKYFDSPNAGQFIGTIINPRVISKPVINGAKYAIMNQNYHIPFLTNNKTLEKGFGQVLNTFGLGTGYQNIRYRNGIRDYLGNVFSKYSTIVPRPAIFTGNQLELARKRVLDNLEKYGIQDSDYVSWTTSIDDPNLIQLSKSIGFEIPSYNKLDGYYNPKVTVTMPAKTYLEHISPIPGAEASFVPSSATIFHQNDGYVKAIQKLYPEFADAHEFSHAIDWVLNNKTHTLPQKGGVNIQLKPEDVTQYNNLQTIIQDIFKPKYPQIITEIPKKDLSKIVDVKVPGLNYNRLKQDIGTQEYHHAPTELKARYEQIRNWLGITNERPLTLTEWNQAKRYYTSSVGDNNMQEFFKLVENPEEFINWASKRYFTNYDGIVTSRAFIEKLPRESTPVSGSKYYPIKVSHDDELPGFLDMIQEQAKGKAPISQTTGLTSYTMPLPSQQLTPSERPNIFNGLRTTFRRQNPETITAGDQAYGLAHNLTGWDRQAYKGILKNTGNWNFDYEEAARALMYDVKAQLYKKLAIQKGGSLTAAEFEDSLLDLNKQDFQNALRNAHGGMYRKDIPLTFNIENLTTEDLNRIISLLTKYKNGGKFYKENTQSDK